jgi:autotransporter passenger strand-loop-strand repeat protein
MQQQISARRRHAGGRAILSDGRVDVLFLSIVSGTTVSSIGTIVVSNAGKAIDMTINHGGTGVVSSGGMFLTNAGGIAEIDGRLTRDRRDRRGSGRRFRRAGTRPFLCCPLAWIATVASPMTALPPLTKPPLAMSPSATDR